MNINDLNPNEYEIIPTQGGALNINNLPQGSFQPATQRNRRIQQGLPVGRNRAVPTMGGQILREPLTALGRISSSISNLPRVIRGEEPRPLTSNYLGAINPLGQGFEVTKGLTSDNIQAVKESVGTGMELGSLIPAARGAKTALTGGRALLKRLSRTAGEEAIAGGLYGAGSELSRDGSAEDIAIGGVMGSIVSAAGGSLLGLGGSGGKALGRAVTKRLLPLSEKGAVKEISKLVSDFIDRGIKPTKKGRNTPQQDAQFRKKSEEGIKSIISNKENLQIADPETGVIENRLPRTVLETPQALEQTRRSLWSKMEEIFTAGRKRAEVDISNTGKALNTIINDVGNTPTVRDYAIKMQQEIADLQNQPPSVLQDRISAYNKKLASYFRATDPNITGNSQVDIAVVRGLSDALEQALNDANLPGIDKLKKQYAGLKTLQESVMNAARKQAQNSKAGLNVNPEEFGFVLYGALTQNPELITSGITSGVLKNILRELNNPDRVITNVFNELDAIYKKYPNQFDIEYAKPTKFEQGVLDTLDAQPPLLPPASGKVQIPGPNVRSGSQNLIPINLPERTQTAIDALDISRAKKESIKRNLQAEFDLIQKRINQLLLPEAGSSQGSPIAIPPRGAVPYGIGDEPGFKKKS